MRQGPWADLLYVAQHRKDNPDQWREDYYYRYSQKFLNQVDFREEIRSAYVMGNVQIEQLNILAGLRFEDTSLLANGPIRRVTPAEQARRTAWVGPVTEPEDRRRAEAEFANRISNQGGYENVFPGIHFKYADRSGLVARASYSTSIGRAPIASLIPTVAVSDSAQTISLANTTLKPQFSDNFDLNLEYYYEPVGLFSVSAFLKEVSGFIYTDSSQLVPTGPNNGFEGMRFLGFPIFEGLILFDLTRSDSLATLRPGLAESWKQAPDDKKTWIFTVSYTHLTLPTNREV